jgi:hypothetical protein
MLTLDAFRDSDGRVILIVSGAVEPPVIYDRNSDRSVPWRLRGSI